MAQLSYLHVTLMEQSVSNVLVYSHKGRYGVVLNRPHPVHCAMYRGLSINRRGPEAPSPPPSVS